MTAFASVALFRRKDNIVFKAPRKERSENRTQARKAAARYWRGNIADPDVLTKIVVVRREGSMIAVAERTTGNGHDRDWLEFKLAPADAMKQPHVTACLVELGIDAAALPPALPDVLEINGAIYRREI